MRWRHTFDLGLNSSSNRKVCHWTKIFQGTGRWGRTCMFTTWSSIQQTRSTSFTHITSTKRNVHSMYKYETKLIILEKLKNEKSIYEILAELQCKTNNVRPCSVLSKKLKPTCKMNKMYETQERRYLSYTIMFHFSFQGVKFFISRAPSFLR